MPALKGVLPAVRIPDDVIVQFQETYRIDPEIQVELREGEEMDASVWKYRVVEVPGSMFAATVVRFNNASRQWVFDSYVGAPEWVARWLEAVGVPARRLLSRPALNR